MNLNLNLKSKSKRRFLISMSTYNNINKAEFKAFFYFITHFFKNSAPQDKCYETLRKIVFNIWIMRKKQIFRGLLVKQTGLHKDTISAHNVKIQENCILDIEHAFKEANRYSSKFMVVLAIFFGFEKPINWESASLFTDIIKYKLINIQKTGYKDRNFDCEMSKVEEKRSKFNKMLDSVETCRAVLCPFQEIQKNEAKSLQILLAIAKLNLSKI